MKSSLFSRKKDRQEENPYAQTPQADPYSAPMTSLQKTQASMGLPSRAGRPGLPTGPGPRSGAGGPPPPAQYGGAPAGNASGPSNGGYGAGGYGASGGYGSNRYDNSGSGSGRPPSYRSTAESVTGGYGGGGSSDAPRAGARRGGYGGLGGDDDGDAGRQALFGSAPEKMAQRKTEGSYENPYATGARSNGGSNYGNSGSGSGFGSDVAGGGASGGGAGGSYDGYGEPRELTEEEREDQDVKKMNSEVRYLRDESDKSLDRSLAVANQAIETARGTMARMHHQRDQLFNAEQNLDQAANHNKIAEHRTAELKHYNRSMFAVKVNNPFTSKQRAAQQAQAAIDEHRSERDQREETRRMAYASNRNAEESFNQVDQQISSTRRLGQNRTGISSKYNLEDDDEDDIAKEQQIDNKMDQLSGAVSSLNVVARAMNQMAEEDLQHLDRIAGKSDAVDDGIRYNRHALDRISRKA